MSTNARFAVGVHILAYLASRPETPVTSVTSTDLASSVRTNPVVIRRLLSSLGKAGLVRAQKGAVGGFILASPPEKITLLSIFRALESAKLLSLPRAPANCKCPVGAKIHGILEDVFSQAQEALEHELSSATLADIHSKVSAICPKAH